jgi:hypothetical protein
MAPCLARVVLSLLRGTLSEVVAFSPCASVEVAAHAAPRAEQCKKSRLPRVFDFMVHIITRLKNGFKVGMGNSYQSRGSILLPRNIFHYSRIRVSHALN